MPSQSVERWHCTKNTCRCERLMEAGTLPARVRPQCICGAFMTRDVPSLFNYLDFLRAEDHQADHEILPQPVGEK